MTEQGEKTRYESDRGRRQRWQSASEQWKKIYANCCAKQPVRRNAGEGLRGGIEPLCLATIAVVDCDSRRGSSMQMLRQAAFTTYIGC